MEISTKSLEYIAVCSILIVIMWIFRDDTPKEIVYPKPDVSDQQFDSHPLIAWPEVDKRGNVCKIKYRVDNHDTKLWIYDFDSGELVHEQPYTRDPSIQDGSYRDFTYTWKLYKTEWTNEIQPGTYQIIVGGNYEPHSANGKVSTLIDIF